jgi:two-component system alkaline phosphatase synthesis response regulator PhoP
MLLQQNEGQCLSREFLLETVWGYQVGTRTRTLDVHILRLRRKLGESSILTIHREGYMWRPDGGPT